MDEFRILIWGAFILLGVIGYFARKQEDKEADDIFEKSRKQELASLIKNVEKRTDFDLFEEKRFWEIIDNSKKRGNSNYKNQIGLLNDMFKKYDGEELIKLDNLYRELLKEAWNWDVFGASSIIFKSSDERSLLLLISMLISRGQVIFNNSIVEVNFISNQDFGEVEERTIGDLIYDAYYFRTGKLMPEPEIEERIELKGEEWINKDLPDRFSKVWDAFA